MPNVRGVTLQAKCNGVEYDGVTRKSFNSNLMWYLPIIQRLNIWFANVNDTKNNRWRVYERVCDGNFFLVADLLQWKKTDSLFPYCFVEPRNLRLRIDSKRMNLFVILSINHTSWLVLLKIYNLSLWLCMKIYDVISDDFGSKTTREQYKCLFDAIDYRFKIFMEGLH